MNVRRRSAVLLSAALLACAAVPALAHDGQDTRPGAARMDLEVLLTPALQGETSPGGQDSSVTVDRFGNVVASALKEQAFRVVSPDGRATTKTRLASWRWSSGDNGESFQNVAASPAGADTLLPGGLSTAVASDDAGHSFVADSYAGTVLLTTVTATDRDTLTTAAPKAVPVASGVQRIRMDATGDATSSGHLYLLTGSSTPSVWSGTSAAAVGTTTSLPGASDCTLAADHRKGSKLVYAGCVSQIGTTDLWTSTDAGVTFTRKQLNGGLPIGVPSVSVAPDGSAWVLVTSGPDGGTQLMSHHVTSRGDVMKDLASEKGTWRGGVLDVSVKGRLGLAAYHLAPRAKGWHVRLSVVSPGATPLWVDFASHDPVAGATATPPDSAPAIAFGRDALLRLTWGSAKATVPGSTAPLVRNVWSVRTLSS